MTEDRLQEGEKEAAVRARRYKSGDYQGTQEEWLVSNSSQLTVEATFQDVIEADLAVALAEKRISEEERTLVFELLHGFSYVEMAKKYGGKDEQYRYKLEVALSKLDLKPKDVRPKVTEKRR